jgi:hypothetical protein
MVALDTRSRKVNSYRLYDWWKGSLYDWWKGSLYDWWNSSLYDWWKGLSVSHQETPKADFRMCGGRALGISSRNADSYLSNI